MSEWWTYTPGDFLMFSPRVYVRLIERYNLDFWPLQLVFVIGMLAVIVFAVMHVRLAKIALLPAFAVAWAFCAWQFLWLRYATINWGATYAAMAFFLQAGLLAILSFDTDHRIAVSRWRRYGGTVLVLFGLLVHPLLDLLSTRSLAAAETFGMMPDPTAITTLGTVLAIRGRRPLLLLPIPLLWCAFSSLTLLAMEDRGAIVPLASIVFVAILLLTPTRP
ncbi:MULTISPECIES: DUF6064 family protein [unclassified Sinorhizobium]|uniref:DUF6064 family protein n=1 Tax=unclassified Sinorhizobium TaxID=2613772 RepID=UPI0024C40EAA|nr:MULTISPECIES: DUF6064 family protein [unclassified Sinorhizobium]MDK1374588.1 DUF6064 family protein [Sinorhizobium sp. 6-70]MDK1478212.1 DUF6064 family protein [Sinorhizobium sp. 6-117]